MSASAGQAGQASTDLRAEQPQGTRTTPYGTEVFSTEVWQEAPRGRPTPVGVLALSGVEVVRSYLTGGSPLSSVARFTGRRLVEAGVGTATYSLPASEWFVSPKGTVHPGILAFLADAPLLAAIQTRLPARTLCTTAELSMTFCTPVLLTGERLLAAGKAIHVDAEMGLAEVFVHDAEGRLVAHGTSRTVVYPPIPDEVPLDPVEATRSGDAVVPGGHGEDGGDTPPGEPALPDAPPDPYQRPAPHAAATSDGSARSGLESLQGVLDGTLPRPPVDVLFGVHLTEAERERVVFEMPAHGWLANEFGSVYGGAIAFLATSAASAAVQSVAEAGTGFSALDLKVNFLRPIMPDDGPVTAVGKTVHVGRHLVVSSSEVTHGGRTIALATGTTALHPGAAS